MKKIIYFSMVLIFLLLLSTVCYADYGIPGIIEYDATVSNEGGAVIADYSGVNTGIIPYGSKIHVLYEIDGKAQATYNNSTVNISLEDIKPVTDEVDISKATQGQKDMYVYREGAYLYNGPSLTYGKVDGEIEIPVGTRVKIEASTDLWGYVEYKGTKGWVYIYTSDGVSPYNMICSLTDIANKNSAHYYTIKEISLSSTVDGKNPIGTIPAGEHIDYYFYSQYPDPHGHSSYIKYKDLEGWYLQDEEEVYLDATEQDVGVFVYENLDIYSDLNFTTKVGSIPERTECKLVYNTLGQYESNPYVEYNGIQGWIKDYTYSIDFNSLYSNDEITLVEDAKEVDISTFSELDKVFKSGDTFEIKYQFSHDRKSYYYITNDKESGWVTLSNFDRKFNVSYDTLSKRYVDISKFVKKEKKSDKKSEDKEKDENTKEDIDTESEENSEDLSTQKNNVDKKLETNLVYCIIGAIALFIIAIIIIIIINKNKKSKTKKEE